jgi:hypothetical protein
VWPPVRAVHGFGRGRGRPPELGADDERFRRLMKRVGKLIEHSDRAQQVLTGPSAPVSELVPWSEELLQDAKLVLTAVRAIVAAAGIPWST